MTRSTLTTAPLIGLVAAGSLAHAEVPTSLRPAIAEMRSTLDLSDAQVSQAEPLVVDRVRRVELGWRRRGPAFSGLPLLHRID